MTLKNPNRKLKEGFFSLVIREFGHEKMIMRAFRET